MSQGAGQIQSKNEGRRKSAAGALGRSIFGGPLKKRRGAAAVQNASRGCLINGAFYVQQKRMTARPE
jgi:hypothetical protein